uniref:Uncharacterized protein n=1 Tax=Arundo donax TaxID=35708 RepID=A0A0A9B4B0_ARUDO
MGRVRSSHRSRPFGSDQHPPR